MRICLSGPSGSGKTTMALFIQKRFGIPFVVTSTKTLWAEYGIRKHEDIIRRSNENPKWGYDWQCRVLDERIQLMQRNPECITDRSPLCNLVYFLMQVSPHISYAKTLSYIDLCKEVMDGYVNGLIYIPYNRQMGLEADGMRVNNPIFQECSQLYFDYVIDSYSTITWDGHFPVHYHNLSAIRLLTHDWADRTKRVENWLTPILNTIHNG